MKAKKLLLSLCAIIMATTLAFSSPVGVADPLNDYVFVTGICRSIPEQPCNDNSSLLCLVRIVINGVSQGNYTVHDEVGCVSPKHGTGAIVTINL